MLMNSKTNRDKLASMAISSDDVADPTKAGCPSWAKLLVPHGLLLLAACIYAVFNILAAEELHGGGIGVFAFCWQRELLAGVALFGVVTLFCPRSAEPLMAPRGAEIKLFLLSGIFMTTFQMCFTAGIKLTDAETAAFFQSVDPSTGAFVAFVALYTPCGRAVGEKCRWWVIPSAILAFAGIGLPVLAKMGVFNGKTTQDDFFTPGRAVGMVLLWGQGLFIALYLLVFKAILTGSKTRRAFGPMLATAWAYTVSFPINLVASGLATAFKWEEPLPLSIEGILSPWQSTASALIVLYSALLASAGGYSIRALAQAKLAKLTRGEGTLELMLYNGAQPPLTILFLFIFSHVIPGAFDIGGAFLLVLAVLVSFAGQSWSQAKAVKSARKLNTGRVEYSTLELG